MEIAIISGKGGTGKSSISAAFATLEERVVLADCDVDAANLFILFSPTREEEHVYISGYKGVIDYSLCSNCGLCASYCRFGAISYSNGRVEISENDCDGCKLCSRICPENAINMVKSDKSRMYAGKFRKGVMVYGLLAPGEENSGKLVNMVREKGKELAKKNNINDIIIDGPPGIGCSAISSITGVDHILIVTEPTLSGLHDLKRTIEISSRFDSKSWVIINKYDLNSEISSEIERYCNDHNIEVIAKLIFDKQMVEAMVNCQSIVEYAPTSDITKEIKKAYQIIKSNR